MKETSPQTTPLPHDTQRIASRLGDQNLPIHTHDPELQDRKDQLDSNIRRNIVEITGYNFLSDGEEPDPNNPKPHYDLPHIGVAGLQPSADGLYYYHTNHLGSTSFVTDENASVVQGFLYAPFGEITNEYNVGWQNGVLPKYSFNAKELDEETGMYYYEARYMAPPVFISRDPLFEKYPTFSPYTYCANNPVKYVDPDGNEALENTDWVKKKGTNQYIWLDGVDCKATTPGIYDYVGPDDEDILKDMGISESFYTKQESRNGLTSRWRPPAVLGAIYSDRRNETTARFSVCAISIKNKKYASFANKEGRVFSGIRFSASVTQISLSIEGGWGGMDYKGGLTIGFADGKYPVYDYLTTSLGQQLNAEHHTTTDASCFITAEQIIKRGVPTTAKITLGYCNKASTNRPIEFNINLKSR